MQPTAVDNGFSARLGGHLGSGLQTTSQQRGSLYCNDPNLPILVNAGLELLTLLSHARYRFVKLHMVPAAKCGVLHTAMGPVLLVQCFGMGRESRGEARENGKSAPDR